MLVMPKNDASENEIHHISNISSTSTYPNSDVASLWIRRNGSDPGFDYGGANVTPSYGMNYFGTNVIQVTWSYNFSNIADLNLFPANCEIYIQSEYDAAYYTAIADVALTDSRIKGAFIDDFLVGLQSPTNMSEYYTNLSHNDGTLGYHLTLGIIVYNRNYMNQDGYVVGYPYSWSDISAYFDIIHFWYYPFAYPLLYSGFIGYEDDFLFLHSLMPSKEYWLGIYLHYYNIGSYELNFTYDQMSVAGKLIKQGYATRYSILENFWIQHNKPTALLVKNFINNELQMDYTTTWYLGTQTALSYSKGKPLFSKLIGDVGRPMKYDNDVSFKFESFKLQNLTVTGASIPSYEYTGNPFNPWIITTTEWVSPTSEYIIWNIRTGVWNHPVYFDALNETASYILEPHQTYKITSWPLTPYTIWANTSITTVTVWDNLLVTVYGMVTVNNTNLTITDSIVQFGNPNTNNSMYYKTVPWYGLTIGTNNVKMFIEDSIIEPSLRAYPYYFNRPYSAYDENSEFILTHSILAGYSYDFRPAGHVSIDNSTLFQVQPRYGDNPNSLWLEASSYVVLFHFNDNLIWNYPGSGVIGIFLMPSNLYGAIHGFYVWGWGLTDVKMIMAFEFNRNTIIGGNYGLWIDMSYSLPTLVINDYNSYAATSDDSFVTFRIDGPATQEIQITTYTIFHWSVKSPVTGPTFVMYYPSLRNGIYTLTTDLSTQNIAVTNGVLTLIEHDWLTYRNNYTLSLFGISIDTGKTFENLIWLLFIFIVPIMLTQVAPKIGFIFGMVLMLFITFIEDYNFLPYMFISLTAIVISVYKSR
jgi:hypothetical protein